MPINRLPENPNLDQLRKQARELQRGVRGGDERALRLLLEHADPSVASTGSADQNYSLSRAQLVVARAYGFASWSRLRQHVNTVTEFGWSPGTPTADESLVDRFLRLACLDYTADDLARRVAAAQLLEQVPDLPSHSIAVAAACADATGVRRMLAGDPSLARTPSGPHRWSPLLYQAYARHDPAMSAIDTLATATALLDAGADPDDGRCWRGLPPPFTVLTGIFGSGESGPSAQPPHPNSIPFARLVLQAGADPNDGQALYNRMFESSDDHLELLFEFGLGRGDGGPWKRRFGAALESPARLLSQLLEWAITHDQRARVRLLAEHGLDLRAPFSGTRMPVAEGRTPVELAVLAGQAELAAELRVMGAADSMLDPLATLVGGLLAGDRTAASAADPVLIAAARAARPGLVVWAASQGRAEAVMLLTELGFDVNARGRGDAPIEQEWETALHVAAGSGDGVLVRLLLELGADASLLDRRFRATPLGWAEFFGHSAVAELLAAGGDP